MKVLLVQPYGVQEGFTRSGTLLPPLGLLYIAAAIRNIADVRLTDADAFAIRDTAVLREIGNWAPDLIGMTASLLTIPSVRRFAREVKLLTNAAVVIGGPLPTTAPEMVLKYDEFDMAAIGDGEPIMVELCQVMESSGDPSTVEGILLRESKRLDPSSCKVRRADLNSITMPAWDLIVDFSHYKSPDSIQLPITIVEARRGCPHACTFCSVPAISGKKARKRRVNDIAKEIDYLTSTRWVREISFVDPDFMEDSAYAHSLCTAILSLSVQFSWFCNAGVKSVKKEIAEMMRSAGCHLIYLGLESGDPEILRIIKKDQSLEQVRKACSVIRNAGIGVSAGFIIGFPIDTDESVTRTIEFAKSLEPDSVQFSLFNWFPGISMKVSGELTSIGFHPKGGDNRWTEWQDRAYAELGLPPQHATSSVRTSR